MAKAKQNEESAPETHIMTIYDLQFSMPIRYKEGHTLTEAEAGALNQAFWEAIGNNKRKKIKDAVDQAEAAGTEVDLAPLQAEIDEYAAEYDFTTRRTPAAVMDPITKAAIPLARDAVRAKLKELGRLDQYVGKNATEENKAKYQKQIEVLAENNKDIRDAAAKLLAEEKKRADAVAEAIELE